MKYDSEGAQRFRTVLGLVYVVLMVGLISSGYAAYDYFETELKLLITNESVTSSAMQAHPAAVYAPLLERLQQTMLGFGVLIALVSFGFVLVWYRQTARYYRNQVAVTAALRDSEARFHQMFEKHGAMMLLIEPQTGMILDANQAALRFYGYTKAELCRMHINQINMSGPERVAADYQHAAGAAWSYFIFPHKVADGTERTVEVYTSPISVQAKTVLFSVIHDITKRVQTEAALQRSEELYRSLVSGLDACLCRWLPDTTLLFTNTKYRTLFGLEEATAHCQWLAFLPDTTREATATFYRELAAQPRTVVYEHAVTAEDGTLRHYQWIDTPILNATGDAVEFQSLGIDITIQKQTEEQLRESQLRVELALQGANMGMWDWHVQSGKAVFNERWATMLGYTLAELEPLSIQTWFDLCHPDDLAQSNALLAQHFAGASAFYACEARMRHRDGRWIWVIDRGKVVEWDDLGAPVRMTGTHLDITERKQAEIALRLSEEKYRRLMESLDSAIFTVDLDGRFLFVNQVAARLFGHTPHELVGRTQHDVFPAPIAAKQTELFAQVFCEDRPFAFEWQTVVQAQPRWYRTSIQPMHDEAGTISYVLVNSTDIHAFKEAQQALLELNHTLEERVKQRTAEVQDLYEHAPTGYHSLDAAGTLILINQTELRWMGYARAEMLGRPYADFLTAPSRSNFALWCPLLKERGWLRDITLECIRKDGTTFPALIHATAVYDEQGSYLMSRATVIDNTERAQAEMALRESEEQNRLLLAESPDAIVLFDHTGRVRQMNRAFELLTGYSNTQLDGHTLAELGLITAEQMLHWGMLVRQHLQAHQRFAAVEFRLTHANGELREVSARVFGLGIRGELHFLTTMRDITAEMQAAATLRHANMELARAARTKDEFLANMSHELRTPLNAILGLSEALQEQVSGLLTQRQCDALRNIEVSGRHLLSLINDILDLSKVEAGRMELQIERVAVANICQSSLMFVKVLATKKALTLACHLHDQLADVEVDPKRLKQMLVNLLSNAVKFTPTHGQVSLVVTTDVAAGVIRFAVQDTGIGIAPQDLSRLFQPFQQLDSSLSRRHEGTGLGLMLVRRLAELHSGEVTVTSAVGQGSCFTIVLPYRPLQAVAAQPQLPAAPQRKKGTDPLRPVLIVETAPSTADQFTRYLIPPPPGRRVLLVDDSEINLETMHNYLQDKGYAVTVARTGQEALEQAAALQPDLILMDIQMSELDGLEAIRRLRAKPDGAATPIIALTALAMTGDRERCLAAGASAYMAKPVSLKALVALIEQLLP
ncbi:MAG: PAS domain S-box protein [Chloroflexales bacterium]